jgi:hypothetical protein
MAGGILDWIVEASEIRRELGCSADEAFALQRERAAERLREYEAQHAEEASNVVYGVDFAKGKACPGSMRC